MPDDEFPERTHHDSLHGSDFPTLQLIEAERQSLGHDIHDDVIPLLFGATSAIASTIDELPEEAVGCRQKLTEAHRWLSEAMRISRRMLGEIHPPELLGQSWVAATQLAVDQLVAEHSTEVQWNLAVDETDAVDVPQEVGVACYRIIVEATRNALAHSHAGRVTIGIHRQDPGFQVKVSDDGVGFDLNQAAQDRFGIRTMIGRAKLIGGNLKIDSCRGGPTSITLTVPTAVPPKR